MDMLGAEMPIIRPGIRCVLHWGCAGCLMDVTTGDDTPPAPLPPFWTKSSRAACASPCVAASDRSMP